MNLDDTTNCPQLDACQECGSANDLLVCTAGVMVGVTCLTLCTNCRSLGAVPNLPSAVAAVHAVLEHCGHLGVDADQMAALLAAEETA